MGRFYFYAQTLQTMSQGCCMSNSVFGLPVMRRSSKIHQILPLFAPYWTPKMLPTKFGSNQFSGFGEVVA